MRVVVLFRQPAHLRIPASQIQPLPIHALTLFGSLERDRADVTENADGLAGALQPLILIEFEHKDGGGGRPDLSGFFLSRP